MASPQSTRSFCKWAPVWVAFFFVLKASVTSIWIIRPYDIPDEVGHFSYIKDLAEGEGLPALHQAPIDVEVWQTFAPENYPDPGMNWIAQHPPLYYVVMVPVYWIGSWISGSFWGAFYAIRVVTALFFSAGIWVMIRAFQEAGMPFRVGLGLGIMLVGIPNHTFLAGGVNHDGMVLFFGASVLYFWVRYLKEKRFADLCFLGIFAGLACLVKYTLLVMVAPLFLWTLLFWWKNPGASRKAIGIFTALAFLPIGFWMLRNWVVLGELLPVDTSGFTSENPLQLSFFQFGRQLPVFSILLDNFWGLIGWMGDGTMQVRWFSLFSVYRAIYTWIFLGLLLIGFLCLIRKSSLGNTTNMPGTIGAFTLPAVVFISGWFGKDDTLTILVAVSSCAIFGWSLGRSSFAFCMSEMDTEDWIISGCILVAMVFLIVYLYTIYGFSYSAGSLQGAFARYFFPVVGFALVGLVARGSQSFRYFGHIILIMAIIYNCNEMYIWLHEVIPFFNVLQ
tara:strand:- start:11252 stop:12763 length:1512 start_codon:yes stop_codon:yes gene_type:complete